MWCFYLQYSVNVGLLMVTICLERRTSIKFTAFLNGCQVVNCCARSGDDLSGASYVYKIYCIFEWVSSCQLLCEIRRWSYVLSLSQSHVLALCTVQYGWKTSVTIHLRWPGAFSGHVKDGRHWSDLVGASPWNVMLLPTVLWHFLFVDDDD